jgi:hypothetical protein
MELHDLEWEIFGRDAMVTGRVRPRDEEQIYKGAPGR